MSVGGCQVTTGVILALVTVFTNKSDAPFVSSATRFVALETKAILVPSALRTPTKLEAGASGPASVRPPSDRVLTMLTVPASRSYRKTSDPLLVSFGTRLVAPDVKLTYRPSALSADPTPATELLALASTPLGPTLIRTIADVCRSKRNTSWTPLVSATTRLLAADAKATNLASPLNRGVRELPLPPPPPVPVLTRVVWMFPGVSNTPLPLTSRSL